MRWKNENQNAETASAKTNQRLLLTSLVERVRKPEADAGEQVQQHEGDELYHHERHHAGEDLVQRHVRRRYALQIERGHRNRWRKERRLQIERDEQPEKQRIDIEVRQQRNED